MRITTWNINGIRTIPQYHPWNTFKSHDEILDHLQADVICFQEVKSSRQGLTRPVAVPSSYISFFSFPLRKAGYSGVATYVRTATTVPLKAEEGLSGILEPKPPLSPEERISKPDAYAKGVIMDEDVEEDSEAVETLDYNDLDSEGRTIVLDFGLFVLINVYCPNDGNGTEERDKYKKDFHRVLEARVKGLVEKEKREVIVVGDLNACAAVEDHCEGPLMVARGKGEGLEGEDGFWGKDVRRWLRDWMVNEDGTGGCMVDIVRKFWPERKGMYTCWNTKISARESNYGTRIDYILVTRGLLPWIKGADIQPQIKGSDHCPVFVDFHDEIHNDNISIKLQDVMGLKEVDGKRDPPRLAANYWDEYSGKQKLLQSFFSKKARTGLSPVDTLTQTQSASTPAAEEASVDLDANPALPETPTITPSSSMADIIIPASSLSSVGSHTPPPSSPSPPQSSQISTSDTITPAPTTLKRKITASTPLLPSSSKKLKQSKVPEKKAGQTKLSNFFAKPKGSSSSASEIKTKPTPTPPSSEEVIDLDTQVDIDADYRLALLLSQEGGDGSLPPSGSGDEVCKKAWTSLLAPIQPPKCLVHGEVTKELTVGKPGPNKGKNFFICARPVGPGYDRGKAERPREEVDPQWKCNFFKWSSEVRREMRKS